MKTVFKIFADGLDHIKGDKDCPGCRPLAEKDLTSGEKHPVTGKWTRRFPHQASDCKGLSHGEQEPEGSDAKYVCEDDYPDEVIASAPLGSF
jgi:hypothetical protein